ncbi:MAG: hypothetical protein NT040_09420 [Bacteroidetes bacterium]|nr:hypothetical protein [Bacteroidota bacterium]
MKKTTIISMFAAITMVFGFSMSNYAQNAKTAPITANATVYAEIAVASEHALDFGVVVIGSDKTVSTLGVATGGSNPSQQGVSQGIGKITRALGASIDYHLTTTTGFLSDGASHTMVFDNYTTAYTIGTTGGTQVLGVPVVTNQTRVAASATEPLVYVHIGGTVKPLAGQIAGVYSGTITLSAEYN